MTLHNLTECSFGAFSLFFDKFSSGSAQQQACIVFLFSNSLSSVHQPIKQGTGVCFKGGNCERPHFSNIIRHAQLCSFFQVFLCLQNL